MALTTRSQGAVEVRVDGIGSLPAPFRTHTGGQLSMEVSKIKPGHMQPGVAIPNPPEVENVVVSANYDLDKWHGIVPQLRAAVTQGSRVSVTRLFLDARQQVFGRGDTFSGVLIRVTPPEYDTDSNDSADIELEIGVDDTVSR